MATHATACRNRIELSVELIEQADIAGRQRSSGSVCRASAGSHTASTRARLSTVSLLFSPLLVVMSSSALSFLITGASSGVGFESASSLAASGRHVIITARTQDKVDATIRRLRAAHSTLTLYVTGYPLELTDFTSIESLVATLSALPSLSLHCLVCNAGSNLRGECHGLQLLWVNNYLGHYHLTRLLLPLMQRTSRTTGQDSVIVQVASVMHRLSSAESMLADAIRSDSRPGSYSHSKLAQVMFAFELQHRYGSRQQPDGRVAAVAVNPGAVNTDIWRHIPTLFTYITAPLFHLMFLTPKQGALTTTYAATATPPPDGRLDYLTPYTSFERWSWLNGLLDLWWPFVSPTKTEANADAYDEERCRELWELSEQQCRSISGKDCYPRLSRDSGATGGAAR